MNRRKLRRIATHIAQWQKTQREHDAMQIPMRLISNPRWAERHLIAPSVRVYARTRTVTESFTVGDPYAPYWRIYQFTSVELDAQRGRGTLGGIGND